MITPALGARTSMVTLSVSICAMTSSSATASPGALAMVPGAIVPAYQEITSLVAEHIETAQASRRLELAVVQI